MAAGRRPKSRRRPISDRDRTGHNGGPPLDEPVSRRHGPCKLCARWKAPPQSEQQAYENFRLGLLRKRVKRPTGSCDHVLIGNNKMEAFSATTAECSCGNFEAAPPKPLARGGGFMTISQNGRIVWQGNEEDMPSRFLQQDFDL